MAIVYTVYVQTDGQKNQTANSGVLGSLWSQSKTAALVKQPFYYLKSTNPTLYYMYSYNHNSVPVTVLCT